MNSELMFFNYTSTAMQISESTHWEIQFGNIDIPYSAMLNIQDYNTDMMVVLRVLFHVYFSSLESGDLSMSAKIMGLIPRLIDPYIPGMCFDAGIDNSEDEYLDEVDNMS